MNYFFQLFEGVSGKTQMDLSGFFTQINEEYNEEDMEPIVRLKKGRTRRPGSSRYND